MSGLFGSLSIAVQSLLTQQAAVEVTSNNIANVNTPGYSRQQPILTEQQPIQVGSQSYGDGVSLSGIESIRDPILELRLQQETQQQGKTTAYLSALQQVQGFFNETQGVGLQGALTGFFNSLQALSTNPTNSPLRLSVITAGQNLAHAFNQAATSLGSLQQNEDVGVTQSVDQINQLSSQIATLNGRISGAEGAGQQVGTLVDQRNELIQQLSNQVDLSVINAGNSITITTSQGTALVVGNQSLALQVQTDSATGFQHVYSQGSDITSTLTAGQIGGLIQARDQTIPSILGSLDTLAAGLANAVNTAHQAGFDLTGAPGGNFFVPPPAGGTGAAAALSVAITDPNKLAASSDGTSGSNGNLTNLLALQNQSIISGQRPADFYTNLIAQIGTDAANASSDQQVGSQILQQLQNQRQAVSGVSLDEEAANLIKYQRAFEAAARVVSVVDELTNSLISIGSLVP